MKNLDKIQKIAEDVHHWAICHSVDWGFNADLCGMCCIASFRLYKRLLKEGIDAHVYIAHNYNKMGMIMESHAFVMVDDYIVDVTATQFNKKPIVIKKMTKHENWFWRKGKKVPRRLLNKELGIDKWGIQSPYYKQKKSYENS
jgi:hypothetical protein